MRQFPLASLQGTEKAALKQSTSHVDLSQNAGPSCRTKPQFASFCSMIYVLKFIDKAFPFWSPFQSNQKGADLQQGGRQGELELPHARLGPAWSPGRATHPGHRKRRKPRESAGFANELGWEFLWDSLFSASWHPFEVVFMGLPLF